MNEEFDLETQTWLNQAKLQVAPFGSVRIDGKGVWMITYAADNQLMPTANLVESGMLGWRIVNTEVRPRRCPTIRATVSRNRVCYEKHDVDQVIDENCFELKNQVLFARIPGQTAPKLDRTVVVYAKSNGMATVDSSLGGARSRSQFGVSTQPASTPMSVLPFKPPVMLDNMTQAANCGKAGCVGDVVFIHGLDGDKEKTWHPANNPEAYWPAMLGDELPNVRFWSVGYDADSSRWGGGNAMPLTDRATNLLSTLSAQGLGDRPIVFVVHSLGGLVLKQMLRTAHDQSVPAWTKILTHSKGVMFLSTPHFGADAASWAAKFGKILRSSVAIEDLVRANPHLMDLNRWFREKVNHLKIKACVHYEKRETAGIRIVDEISADPGISGVVPIPEDCDHIEIAKPKRSSALFVHSMNFVRDCIIF